MNHHEKLYRQAKEAVAALFSDTSVSSETTRSSLQALKDEIDVMLSALKEDR